VIRELPDPVPGPGQVVVNVEAAGLNFPDSLIIEGKYQARPEPPFSPGFEAAGVVAEVGEGVELPLGTRVIGLGEHGAFAEKWLIDASMVQPVPDSMDAAEAAGFGLIYGTSYYALRQRAGLREGETLLVLGAAGGVGSAAVDLGRAMGARIIAAASSPEKLEFARSLGAGATINYAEEDLRDRVKELTDGAGADVVFDPVGGDLTDAALRSTAWDGRLLVIGFAAGDIPRVPLNLPLLKSISIVGVFWGGWARRDPAASAANFAELFQMIDEGALTPRVTEVLPLEHYLEAFRLLTERRARGKIVLRVR
jgi:NADPH2:quinone reductase